MLAQKPSLLSLLASFTVCACGFQTGTVELFTKSRSGVLIRYGFAANALQLRCGCEGKDVPPILQCPHLSTLADLLLGRTTEYLERVLIGMIS